MDTAERLTRLASRIDKAAMKSLVGPGAEKKTWQADFPLTIPCSKEGCNGTAELAFTSYEGLDEDNRAPETFVYDLKEQTGKPGGLWLHDACAVAIYFCRTCLKATAEWNQG